MSTPMGMILKIFESYKFGLKEGQNRRKNPVLLRVVGGKIAELSDTAGN